jgi:hypothetical protein
MPQGQPLVVKTPGGSFRARRLLEIPVQDDKTEEDRDARPRRIRRRLGVVLAEDAYRRRCAGSGFLGDGDRRDGVDRG